MSQVAPIDKLSVVLGALMSVAFLGEWMTVRQWLGIGPMDSGGIVVALR